MWSSCLLKKISFPFTGILLNKNLRIIPLEDIGLALWKVSTAEHCNPARSANSILRGSNEFEQDAGATIVENTEDIDAASTGIDVDDRVIDSFIRRADVNFGTFLD